MFIHVMQVATGDTVPMSVADWAETVVIWLLIIVGIIMIPAAVIEVRYNKRHGRVKPRIEVPHAEPPANWDRYTRDRARALSDGQGPYPASAFTTDNNASQPEEGEPYDDEDDDGLDYDPNEDYPRAEEFDPLPAPDYDPDDEDDYPEDPDEFDEEEYRRSLEDDEDNLAEILHGKQREMYNN